MSKYSEILKGDVVPRSALSALDRKVSKQGRILGELRAAETARAEAGQARTPGQTFVTRDELLEFAETGNIPDAWVESAPDPAADGA